MPDKTILQIFAKQPILGNVKTRLIPEFGVELATRIYSKLLFGTIDIALNLPNNFTIELWLDQLNIEFLPKIYFNKLPYIFEQQGNNLGRKLFNSIFVGLQIVDNVIIVGSDCLTITAKHYVKIAKDLKTYQVVIIPADDGGYVLFACSKVMPEWFENITWSSDKVLQQTMAKLNGIKYKIYPPMRDLDTYQDYLWYENKHLLRDLNFIQ